MTDRQKGHSVVVGSSEGMNPSFRIRPTTLTKARLREEKSRVTVLDSEKKIIREEGGSEKITEI